MCSDSPVTRSLSLIHLSKICPQHAQWKWWLGRTGWDIGLCLIPLWELAGFDGPSEIHCQDQSKSDILTSSGSLRHDVLSCFLWVVTLVLTEEEPYLMNTGRFRKTNRFVEGEYIKYSPIERLLLFIKQKKKESWVVKTSVCCCCYLLKGHGFERPRLKTVLSSFNPVRLPMSRLSGKEDIFICMIQSEFGS